jgi:large subunit ribosomal protein LX
MTEYVISGRFQSRDGYREFTKTVEAPNEDVAREFAYARLGSEHGLKRVQIELDDVGSAEEVAA